MPLFEIHNNVYQKVIGLDLNNLRESYLSKGLIWTVLDVNANDRLNCKFGSDATGCDASPRSSSLKGKFEYEGAYLSILNVILHDKT